MDHHARYGSTRYWLVGGGVLAGAAFAALIVEATSVPMGQKLTAMLVTLAAWLAGVLVVAASVGLRAVGSTRDHFTGRVEGIQACYDELKQCTEARYDELNLHINNQVIEAYSLGLAQGARMRDTGGGIRVN